MKTFLSLVGVIVVVGVLGALAHAVHPVTPATGTLSTRLQVCPEQMIMDKMPGTDGSKPAYYILKGERREISEFDDVWVARNCQIPTQTVY
jgi:hypothetical protein